MKYWVIFIILLIYQFTWWVTLNWYFLNQQFKSFKKLAQVNFSMPYLTKSNFLCHLSRAPSPAGGTLFQALTKHLLVSQLSAGLLLIYQNFGVAKDDLCRKFELKNSNANNLRQLVSIVGPYVILFICCLALELPRVYMVNRKLWIDFNLVVYRVM